MRYLIALVLLSACGPRPTVRSDAVIARGLDDVEGRAFLACEVRLGWTYDELVDWCGTPDRMIKRARSTRGTCYYYATKARSFTGGAGANGVVVCTTVRSSRTLNGSQSAEIVDTVVGIDGEP